MTEPVQAQEPQLTVTEIFVDDVRVLAESILYPWGDDDNVVEAVLAGSYNESVSLKLWSLLAQKAPVGEIVVDVGAYTGIFSILAARSSWINKIVAFEPSAITFGRLVQNITLNGVNGRIIPCNLAASDTEALLTMPHRWGHYALCSGESFDTVEIDHTQPAFGVPLDSLLVPSRSVHYLNSQSSSPWPFSRVAAIKIDVEGAEIAVLTGARALIARDRPVIIAEALGTSAEAALAAFAGSVGYTIQRVGNEWNFALFAEGDETAEMMLERATAHPAVLRGVRRFRYAL